MAEKVENGRDAFRLYRHEYESRVTFQHSSILHRLGHFSTLISTVKDIMKLLYDINLFVFRRSIFTHASYPNRCQITVAGVATA